MEVGWSMPMNAATWETLRDPRSGNRGSSRMAVRKVVMTVASLLQDHEDRDQPTT